MLAAGRGIEFVVSPGPDCHRQLAAAVPDLLVVDDAVARYADLIRDARASHPTLPILFIAARPDAIVAAISAGANDFAFSHASSAELALRVQLLPMSLARAVQPIREIGPLRLNRVTGTLANHAHAVALTPIELKVFEHLVAHLGRPVRRAELENSIWGQSKRSDAPTNVAVVYISYLRKKLRQLGDDCWITTIPTLGYALEIKVAERSNAAAKRGSRAQGTVRPSEAR
jgi:DNA-binding response OmpR family regulator